VGVINADVSTCIAGWLDRKPDLIPVRITIGRSPGESPTTFNVQVVRQRSLLPALLLSSLMNSVDMEGELPEEVTAELQARIDVEGHEAVVIKDTFSGAGLGEGRAPKSLYNQISSLVSLLQTNSYKPIRINRIDCETQIEPGRRTAEIEAVEL